MIRSIEIKNLRGIREGKLDDLTPLVILVGPNGSGKSTVLDALLIGASPTTGEEIGQAVERRSGVTYGARWLLWRAGYKGPASVRVVASDGMYRTCNLAIHGGPQAPEEHTKLVCEILTRDLPTRDLLIEFEQRRVAATAGNLPNPPLDGIQSIHLVDARSLDQQAPLHKLYTRAIQQGHRKEVEALLRAVVPDLEKVEILSEGNLPLVHLELKTHSIPAALAGDGIQALLRLSLELSAPPGGVVLLEEPEVHQHPGSLRQTARAIVAAVRRDIQVILTTHSLELIDAVLSDSLDEDLEKLALYSLVLEDGILKSSRLPGRDVSLARTTIEQDLR